MRLSCGSLVALMCVGTAVLSASDRASAQGNGPDSVRTGAIIGMVWDSASRAPLTAAHVAFLDTGYDGATNSDGRFFIPNLPPGRYRMTIRHPSLNSLGYTESPVTITVEAGRPTEIRVVIPPRPRQELAAEEVDSVTQWLKEIGVRTDASLRTRIRAGDGETATLYLAVVDPANQRGIAGAAIQLHNTRFNVITDSNGRAIIRGVPPGKYLVRVQMLGYADPAQMLEVGPGQRMDVRVDMAQEAIRINSLVVEVRSRALDNAGFYDRRNDPSVWGRFFTAAEMQRRNVQELSGIFHSIPGAVVQYEALGKRRILFRRARGSSQYCEPPVYVDGQRFAEPLDMLSPIAVAGLEVYVGTHLPIEYANSGFGCGVILVWTNRRS